MNKLLFVALIAVSLISCDKNQKAVKTLDGEWKATSYPISEDGLSLDLVAIGLIQLQLDFENCKLKDEETCDVAFNFSFLGESDVENYMYKVTDDGTTLVLITDSSSTEESLKIDELTKTNLQLSGVFDGDQTVLKFEKL